MAVGVVDLLEAVEVEAEEGGLVILRGRQGEGVAEPGLDPGAVGDTGEEIVVCLVEETLVELLALCDVLEEREREVAAAGMDVVSGDVDAEEGAVLPPVDALADELLASAMEVISRRRASKSSSVRTSWRVMARNSSRE
jgi:hypothetical protein